MNTNKQSPHDTHAAPRSPVTGRRIAIVVVFMTILAVYAVTLFSFFPNMPVISRAAETIPGYDETYPPFRLDEYSYYTIAESILAGDIYADDAKEFHYPIGFPIIAAPFIALFGEIGGYLANMLILWCAAIIFYLIVRRTTGTAGSLIMTGVLALATLNWFYATSCYTEPLSQLLVLAAFAFLTTTGAPGKRHIALLLVAGILLGLNLFVRPHYILLAVPFFGYLLFPSGRRPELNRDTMAFVSGVTVIILCWLVRNGLVFGSPFSFEYSGIAGSFLPAGE
ncbi:ArnT family glycosyltransferase, partial [Candidatus Latescibacterota bacterium]